MLVFPNGFPEPNSAGADNCGDSYSVSIEDSTITTTSDAHYKHTRARTTRMIQSWIYSWVGVSDADFSALVKFYRQVGTYQSFMWSDPADGTSHEVRFADKLSWQWIDPSGWQGSLKFEEV